MLTLLSQIHLSSCTRDLLACVNCVVRPPSSAQSIQFVLFSFCLLQYPTTICRSVYPCVVSSFHYILILDYVQEYSIPFCLSNQTLFQLRWETLSRTGDQACDSSLPRAGEGSVELVERAFIFGSANLVSIVSRASSRAWNNSLIDRDLLLSSPSDLVKRCAMCRM